MGCLLLLPHQSLVSGEVHRASHISKMVLSTVKIGPGNGGSNHAGFVSNRRCQLASSPTAHVYLIFLCRLNNRYPGPRGHEGDEGVRIQGLLGFQLRPFRLQPGHGAGRSEETPHPGARPGCVPHRQTHLRHGRGRQRDGAHHKTLNDEGVASPRGKL